MKEDLERIRAWAQSKIQGGSEPPWAWYQYMKLVETCDAILAGQAATATRENLPQSPEHSGAHLQLVDSTYQPDSAQPHHVGLPVQMPM
jgi:hypothetical protein